MTQTPTRVESTVKSMPSEPDSRTIPAGGRTERATSVTSAGCTDVVILGRDQHNCREKGKQ
jgi:hypothetical protein